MTAATQYVGFPS